MFKQGAKELEMFEQLKTYFEYSLLYSHIFREMNVWRCFLKLFSVHIVNCPSVRLRQILH